jgi:hypothetical protein
MATIPGSSSVLRATRTNDGGATARLVLETSDGPVKLQVSVTSEDAEKIRKLVYGWLHAGHPDPGRQALTGNVPPASDSNMAGDFQSSVMGDEHVNDAVMGLVLRRLDRATPRPFKPALARAAQSALVGAAPSRSDVRSPTSTEVRSPTSTATEVRSPTSTSTEVRSPTSTSTEVRSPTSTSTDAYTQGNITVTGGAGAGATHVTIYAPPAPQPKRADEQAHLIRSEGAAGRMPEMILRTGAPRVPPVMPPLMQSTGASRPDLPTPKMMVAVNSPRAGAQIPAMMRAVNAAPKATMPMTESSGGLAPRRLRTRGWDVSGGFSEESLRGV